MKDTLFSAFQYLTPQHLLSRAAGCLAESTNQRFKNFFINRFINHYNVDMSQAARKTADEFTCFNDFFTRELVTDARPFSDAENQIISPADGAISQLGPIDNGRIVQAKHQWFTLGELLGGQHDLATQFSGGSFATIYLSPKDYHRVHMPIAGKLTSMIHIPGDLFSVNQATANKVPRLFARNERLACIFDTAIGPVAVILVGAMIVASIETIWAGLVTPQKKNIRNWQYTNTDEIVLNKGDEMGRFKLGSTVVLLFPKNTVNFEQECVAEAKIQMGENLATI